ncbi:MAG: IPT/TIG domain-containing protein, partial [Myxococcota bacterium]
PPLALDTVDPTFGPNAGGTRVTVTGSFDAATTVEFDGVPGSIVSSTTSEIVVDTPAIAGDGWVDVRAVSGVQSDTIPSGYQYWEDGAGSSGTFGWLTYVRLVGGYWTNPQDGATGVLAFTTPNAWEPWTDYAPTMDTCAFNYGSTAPGPFYDPGAAHLDLSSGATSARLVPNATIGAGAYSDLALTPNVDVVPGLLYDLDPVAGNADWPGFGVDGIVEVPPAFTVTVPDLDRANAPNVTRSFTLEWDGGGGDYVLIYILRQYLPLFGNWTNDGVVTCAVSDTGVFTIPSNVWPDWYVDDFLHIEVGRVIERHTVLPHDGSESRTMGIYWYYGGAYTIR